MAQTLVAADSLFFNVKGPGAGNKATNAFMSALRARAREAFGADFAERRICGDSGLCVDYYFPREATIVEIALGLRNPKTEFEKDILKAIMAQEASNQVTRLLFISKPGAIKKCTQPGRRDIIEWARTKHRLAVEVRELRAEGLRPSPDGQ